MKNFVLIDSFKGSISSLELGKFISNFFKGGSKYIPFSDGGEGFLDFIEAVKITKREYVDVHNLFLEKIRTYYLLDEENNAYIESAKVIGLSNKKDILKASTYGLGEMILNIIKQNNVKRIYVGLGGSGSSDLGLNMLYALGVKFYHNDELIHLNSVDDYFKINRIEFENFEKIINGIEFYIVSDVENVLLGKNGSNYVFARQKGANDKDIEILEAAFLHIVNLLKKKMVFQEEMGDGAAGGLGFVFKKMFLAKTLFCRDLIEKFIDLNHIKKEYDYIITGEGKVDGQSLQGKVLSAVMNVVDKNKLIIICGQNKLDIDLNIYALSPKYASVDEAIKNPLKYLTLLLRDIENDYERKN